MELLQLKYFRMLAREQHVSRTAELLHISQSSLSLTIKKLEDELGVRLFDRAGRHIRLNAYGKAYLEYIEAAFCSLENGRLALEELDGKQERSVSLGLLSPYIWQEMVQAFMESSPEVAVAQHSIEAEDYRERILSGELDFYLGALDTSDAAELESILLYEDSMVLLVNRSHPLANYKRINLEKARNEVFISLPKGTSLRKFIDGLCLEAGFSPKSAIECDYTLRDEMVAAGYGVSITTKRSSRLMTSRKIVSIDLKHPATKRVLRLAWGKNRRFTTAMRSFYSFVFDYYRCKVR